MMKRPLAVAPAFMLGVTAFSGGAMAESSAEVEALERRVERLEAIIRANGLAMPPSGEGDRRLQPASTTPRAARSPNVEVAAETPKATFDKRSSVQALAADRATQPAKEAAQDEPLAFRIGEHTTADIGGYVKVNALYSDFSTGRSDDRGRELYTPSRVNVGNGPGSTAADFSARWTRVNLSTDTRLGGHVLESFVEFDFVGADANEATTGSYGLRLRDAFFELDDRWLFGQTDSVFMDNAASTETLDQIGPAESISLVRQTQIRYMGKNWAVALENPSNTLDIDPRGTNTTATALEESWPELTGDYLWPTRFGHIGIGGVAKRVSNEGIENPATGQRYREEAAFGYGLRLSGRVKVGTRGDDVRFSTIYGDGLGRYVGLGITPAGYVRDDGKVENIAYAAGYIGYKHVWAPQWRSNLVVGTLQVGNDGLRRFDADNAATKSASSVHFNLIWNPITPLSFGGEYIHARREVEDGRNGRLDRLQFSAKYAF